MVCDRFELELAHHKQLWSLSMANTTPKSSLNIRIAFFSRSESCWNVDYWYSFLKEYRTQSFHGGVCLNDMFSTGVLVSSSLIASKASWWLESQLHSVSSRRSGLSGSESFVSLTIALQIVNHTLETLKTFLLFRCVHLLYGFRLPVVNLHAFWCQRLSKEIALGGLKLQFLRIELNSIHPCCLKQIHVDSHREPWSLHFASGYRQHIQWLLRLL